MVSELRQVVESPRFAREKEQIEPDVAWLDHALDAFVFALARKPELGTKLTARGLWLLSADFPNNETVSVYYTFDRDTVTLESIRKDNLEELRR